MALRVGSRELKNQLGRYLQLVRDGATVIVTHRGTDVAELRPLADPPKDLEAALDRMAAEGLITRAKKGRLQPIEPILGDVDLTAAILEDREDRF